MTAMTNTNRVYGGTWNPVSGAYPLHNGDGCVWDVVLNDGVENFKFDGIVWGGGHRVGYDAATKTYHQITSNAGVHSVNGKNGSVVLSFKDVGARPETWMPTPADVNAVPLSRKVNNKALDKDVNLTHVDVGAVPLARKVNGKSLNADINLTPADVGAVSATTEVNGKPLSKSIALTSTDVGALPLNGTAVLSTATEKFRTPRKISGVDFDGSKDITLEASNVGAVPITRKINGKLLSGDVSLSSADVGALASTATATAATKLATARKISGVAFDGTKDIILKASDVGALPISGGTLAGSLLLDHGSYKHRLVLSSDYLFYQGGKGDGDVNDQKIAFSGYNGTGLTDVRFWMKDKTTPSVRWGSSNHLMYHQGFKPTPADIGAVTVEDHVELPFPDVWIPFNDNLRMLAGYGEDIKVGDETVATKVSFSRASTATYIDKSGVLRTAAVNVPRFEKEGLLIEGQSTNVIKCSETYNPVIYGGVVEISKSQIMGFNFVKQVNDGTNGGSTVNASDKWDIKTGDVLTYSAVFKLPEEGETAGRFRCRVGWDEGFAFDLSFYAELSLDREPQSETNVITKTQPFSDKTLVKVVRTWTATKDYTGAYLQLQSLLTNELSVTNVGCHQIELLPFATSYIPTNGAAATRVGDVCFIPRVGNYKKESMTFSAEIKYSEGSFKFFSPIVAFDSTNAGKALQLVLPSNQKDNLLRFSAEALNANSRDVKHQGPVVCRLTSNQASICTKNNIYSVAQDEDFKFEGVVGNAIGLGCGTRVSGTPAPSSSSRVMHFKNLRIWHRALSDAQLKYIR